MTELGRGFLAGFIATLVITLLMIMRLQAGIMPWFNPIEIMNLTSQELIGTPDSSVVGWAIHFLVGTVLWGGLFARIGPHLNVGNYVRRGLLFGTGAWLVVMVTAFPLAGSGLFGLGFGIIVPILALITHWIFGAALGASFDWLEHV